MVENLFSRRKPCQQSIIAKTQDKVIVQIEIPLSKSMLEGESWIQDALNKAGTLATGEL